MLSFTSIKTVSVQVVKIYANFSLRRDGSQLPFSAPDIVLSVNLLTSFSPCGVPMQVENDAAVNEPSSHIVNIGRMVEVRKLFVNLLLSLSRCLMMLCMFRERDCFTHLGNINHFECIVSRHCFIS